MAINDMKHFVELRKELTAVRAEVENTRSPLEQWQRDLVAIAQAEALCDLAATMNDSINVAVSE